MFFVVGVLLGKRKNRAYSLIPWISLLLVSIIAMQVETSYLDSHSFKNPTGIKPSSHFYALVIVFVLFSEKLQKCISSFPVFEKYIAILGRTSFGIYLIHLYILNHLVTKFCHRWIIATLLTVLLSWLVVSFGRHVLGNKSKWLGFKI